MQTERWQSNGSRNRNRVLHSTGHDATKRPIKEIVTSLDVVMRRRRLVEPHGWQPVQDANIIADMMNAWRRELIRQELTPEQKQKAEREQASIFNDYLKRTHGGKHDAATSCFRARIAF